MNKKPIDKTGDPFARLSSIGESTDIPDTHDEEEKAISESIPHNNTTDEGVRRVAKMTGKTLPPDFGMDKQVPPPQDMPVFTEQTVFTNSQPIFDEVASQEEQSTPSEDIPTLDTKVDTPTKEEAKPAFTDEEVLPLLDSMLTSGYVKDEFTIRSAKVSLRTQFFWEDQLIVEYTDSRMTEGTLRATGNFYFQVYALAANLESFGGNYFKPLRQGKPTELRASFQERVDFLYTLPSFLVTYLFERRSKFLAKIQFITENFERLVKVF